MIAFFANLFGYLLNFLYTIIQNYGFAIILFSIIVKIILLPISIKQQKTMKKTMKIQVEMKILQVKYKNNPEELEREMVELYKREKLSPFGGCFSPIIQIILLFSVFFLVRSPLTYMKKIDTGIIEKYTTEISENREDKDPYPEISIIREKSSEDEQVYINMNFLGLDLSSIPNHSMSDWKVYVIPVLYVVSSIISMKITTNMQNGGKSKKQKLLGDGEMENKDTGDELEMMNQMNKSMSFMMPILAVSVSFIAPLGLALYWLTNNILMILERVLLNIILKDKEEEIQNV